jgi:carbamoyltransferase
LEEFRQMIVPKGPTFELNLDYFTHVQGGINMSWDGGSPKVAPFHSRLMEERLGPARKPDEKVTPRHENIAASLQAVTEEIIVHLLTRLHESQPSENVVLVGGCAMNSVAVGKVSRQTPFQRVYVPVGAADNGTSIGAAFHVWHRTLQQPRAFRLEHAFWGDGVNATDCREAAQRAGLAATEMPREALLDFAVDEICAGKVIGWFQDRMEFGARALGSRSLLADPRRTDMRDIINLKIKFRERFRPFAPSVLEEYVGEYFEVEEASPFMERVLPIREEMRAAVPAVTHVDGSGRLQTVSRQSSPLYWELIDRFRQRTGVPMLLNTSLNENEPIVRTPDEAIRCYQRTAMDALVLGNLVIQRNGK